MIEEFVLFCFFAQERSCQCRNIANRAHSWRKEGHVTDSLSAYLTRRRAPVLGEYTHEPTQRTNPYCDHSCLFGETNTDQWLITTTEQLGAHLLEET
jgi:hypothetical protein